QLGVREKNDSKIMLARLQADRGQMADILFRQGSLKFLKLPAGKHRKWFGQFGQVSEGEKSATAVGQFADVFSGAFALKFPQKLRREASLYGGQNTAPLLGDADYRPTGG